MTITQTITISDSRRLTIEIPREIPAGAVVITFTPASEHRAPDKGSDVANRKPISRFFGIISPDTYGDGVAYQRKLRDEWDA